MSIMALAARTVLPDSGKSRRQAESEGARKEETLKLLLARGVRRLRQQGEFMDWQSLAWISLRQFLEQSEWPYGQRSWLKIIALNDGMKMKYDILGIGKDAVHLHFVTENGVSGIAGTCAVGKLVH